ncbi:peptide-N4-(N-acetyl-beta- glucosaminyl)asparagine amidase [Ceratobasidium sp. 394]|nr:peptide-N4-(N-acetyl-beta- glucosaminyl)asparagine amidase [Ceratobasidium sp. 394]
MDLASAQALSLRLLPRLLRHAQRNGWARPRPVTPEELAQFQVAVAFLMVTAGIARARPLAPRTDNIPRQEPTIFSTFRNLDKQMDIYEDQELQDLARQEIPIQRLQAEATALQQSDSPLACQDDALAQVLVKWFKNEYFKWADPIKCPKCSGKTEMTGMVTPNEYERAGGAGRVEMHVCTRENGVCDGRFRFPRFKYVHPIVPNPQIDRAPKRPKVPDENPPGTLRRMGKPLHALSPYNRPARTLRYVPSHPIASSSVVPQ